MNQAILIFLQFALSSTMAFMRKGFIKFFPHPFVTSVLNSISILPLAILLDSWQHKWARLLDHIIPPKEIVNNLIISGILNSGMMITANIGFYSSALDFILLFQLTSLIWNSLLGYIFLHERISRYSLFSIFIIFCGILMIVLDFDWSTKTFPSSIQILLQTIALFLSAAAILITKKTLNTISTLNTKFDIYDLMVWKSILSFFPTLFVSLWKELDTWGRLDELITMKVVVWTSVLAVVHELAHIVMTYMQQTTSMISLGVIDQVRVLATLVLSHFVYNETKWKFTKLVAVALLITGGISYSYFRSNEKLPSYSSADTIEEEEVLLISSREEEES